MSKLYVFAVGVALAVGACGSKDPLDKAMAGMEDWKTKMCACKDKACTEKVHEDYKKWENDVLEPMMKGKKESDMPKDKMDKAEKLDEARKECRRKFRDDGAAAPAGDGAAPAAPAAPTP